MHCKQGCEDCERAMEVLVYILAWDSFEIPASEQREGEEAEANSNG